MCIRDRLCKIFAFWHERRYKYPQPQSSIIQEKQAPGKKQNYLYVTTELPIISGVGLIQILRESLSQEELSKKIN